MFHLSPEASGGETREASLERAGASAPAAAQEAAAPAALRLLLVEDDDVDARLIGLYAAAMGGRPVAIERAVSAESALALAEATRFDLCIADFWLGCETNLRLLGELACRHPGLPVLVLTSLSTPDIRLACRQAGAVHFLGKEGMGPETLRAAVEASVAQAEAAAGRQGEASNTILAEPVDFLSVLGGTAEAAAVEIGRRPLLGEAIEHLPDQSETLRLGFFERLLPGLGGRGAERLEGAEIERLLRAAAGLARGVLVGRAQAVRIQAEAGGGLCASAPALAFLFYELVCRASQQSASDGRIEARLRVGDGRLSLGLRIGAPTPASLGVAGPLLGPLARQVMQDHRGTAANRTEPDGGLILEAELAGRPGPERIH